MDYSENKWIYQESEVNDPPENVIGFVYCITNLLDGRKYIGKKKKIKTETESDWTSYFGSNTELQEDVKKHGVENFRREILKMCYTLGEMSYWETYEIFVRHAVPSPEYYNVWVSVRVRSNHLPKTFMEKIK